MTQLTRWYAELVDPISTVPGLVATDVDEVDHVLGYWVEDEGSRASVEAIVRLHGVPGDAVVIALMERATVDPPRATVVGRDQVLTPEVIWLIVTGAVLAPVVLLVAARSLSERR